MEGGKGRLRGCVGKMAARGAVAGYGHAQLMRRKVTVGISLSSLSLNLLLSLLFPASVHHSHHPYNFPTGWGFLSFFPSTTTVHTHPSIIMREPILLALLSVLSSTAYTVLAAPNAIPPQSIPMSRRSRGRSGDQDLAQWAQNHKAYIEGKYGFRKPDHAKRASGQNL